MSKVFEDTRFGPTSPLRYFLFLFPFAIATMLGVCTMGSKDTAPCLWWAFFLLLIGLVTLPLATKIWENFSSGGFILSQTMGLVDSYSYKVIQIKRSLYFPFAFNRCSLLLCSENIKAVPDKEA